MSELFDDIHGGDAKFLARGSNPAWSPDGRYIAFSYSYNSVKDGPNPIPDLPGSVRDIYIVSVTGGEPERLTRIDNKKLAFESPRWSPDGKKIAFYRKTENRTDF